MSLKVDIVSPEKVLMEGEANVVVTRSTDGEIAFLPGHIPFIGVLKPHTVKIELTNGKIVNLELQSGFVEVSNDQVTILSDTAELSELEL